MTSDQLSLRAKWVAALRSGKYTQGREALRVQTEEGYNYCCLGVLCDLVAPELWKGDKCAGQDAFLPLTVQAAVGLSHNDGTFVGGKLWKLNDGTTDTPPLTFAQIADIIESAPAGLFTEN